MPDLEMDMKNKESGTQPDLTARLGTLLAGRRAALIDMDGVLYDSMPHHTLAWRQMMLGQGVDVPREEFYLYEGMTGPATINLLMRRERGEELTMERCREIYAEKSRIFISMGEVDKMEGAGGMLQALMDGGLKRVLVTGSAQSTLLRRLDSDYPGAFGEGMRVTALDVKEGKPAPEPYLKGMEKAGVTASEAIVIENAPLGVRSGKRAGAAVVAVRTGPIPREAFVAEGADIIFDSMPAFAKALHAVLVKGE